MSYQIIKELKIQDGKVFINCASNNVYPRNFSLREDTFLTEMLKNEGEQAVNLEILRLYENGVFQTGNPNKWSKAINRLSKTDEYQKYNWRKSTYKDECPIYQNRYKKDQTEFNNLLLKSLTLKN